MKQTVLSLIFLTFALTGFCQTTLTLKSKAQLRKTDSPLGDVLSSIPANSTVRIVSSKGGYYKVDYDGKVGYINEIFFEASGIDKSINSVSTGASNMSNRTSNNS